MLPTLKKGMRLLVEKVPPADIRPSDIIMYKIGNDIIAHRVIKIISKSGGALTFITKGDNHAYTDCSHISQENLMGIVSSAFNESDPDRDVLIKSALVGSLYVAAGNIVLAVRSRREGVPAILRSIFKYFVGGIFFIFKKFIHAVYMGIYCVQLSGGK